MCTSCDEYKHLGWRFSSVTGDHSFYALIVAHANERGAESVSASGDMVALQEGVLNKFNIGVPAPAWVLALMSTVGTVTSA